MTDYSSWTDEQVNEAIFKAKGWKWFKYDDGIHNIATWINPTIHSSAKEIPDYTHSWDLCGELLEEMGELVSLECFAGNWIFAVNGHEFATSDSPKRAISEGYLPWLAWKEQG